MILLPRRPLQAGSLQLDSGPDRASPVPQTKGLGAGRDQGGPALFLFDFDNTLFPTRQLRATYFPDPDALRSLIQTHREPGWFVPPRIDMAQVLTSMQRLLAYCTARGVVHVVSLATPKWLRLTLGPYLEGESLGAVGVHSSRRRIRWRRGPAKLPVFRRLVGNTPWRQVFVVGDGCDEWRSGELLTHYCRAPVRILRLPSGRLTANQLLRAHQLIMAEFEKNLAPGGATSGTKCLSDVFA